jgi:cobalt-zinc-cadmium efflux system outer membrane protein
MALSSNPTLVQATARIQAAQGRWLQGGLRPNPILGYQASEVGNSGRAGQQGAFYSQEFVRGGKLELNRVVGSREVAQAQQQFEAQRQRVLNDVRIEYFNVLTAQRALDLTRELADIGIRGVEVTDQLFQREQVSKADVLQARIESASAAIALRNAQNRNAAAWRRLSSVIGTPDMAIQALSGDVEPQLADLDWNESYTRLIAQSPELASARAGVARAQAILERAQVEPVPNLDVQLGVQYDNASEFMIGNVQVGVPIPFRNRNQGNIQTAFADLRNAQAEIGRLELSLRNRLALAYESYSNARNQVETFVRQILPDARSSLDLVSSAYRQGQVNFLTLLTAQRTFSQANLAYLQALQELNANRVAIEGLLLTGSLQGESGSIDAPRLTGGIAPVFGPGKPPVEQN